MAPCPGLLVPCVIVVSFLSRLSTSRAFCQMPTLRNKKQAESPSSSAFSRCSSSPSALAMSPLTEGTDAMGTTGKITKEGAVIIGGGPSGIATALMLAKRGWTNISVIERTPSADYFDPNVAFVYQIDRRGQYFLDEHGLTDKLAAVSVDTREFTLTRIPATGERQELSLPVIDDSRPTGYWLPRSVFQKLLYDEVTSSYPEQIKMFYSATCTSIEQVPGRSGLEVKATLNGEGREETTFYPRLLVGADGLKSTVRQSLRSWDAETGNGKQASGKGRFDMRKQPSGSSGLRYKVLALAPSFRLGITDDERAKSEKAYAVLSSFKDAKRSMRIGVLPWGPPGGEREKFPRGGNFITLPGHPLWNVKTGDEMKAYLAEAFPQIPITEDISDAELSRFAESQGGRFPDPQYCPGLQWVVGLDNSSGGGEEDGSPAEKAGVALVGDAIHAFPPDLGQGVNSALEDVVVLGRALESCGDRVEASLPEYQRLRAADSKALVRMCQIGYPWQYKQPAFVQSKLWFANFLLRTKVLNKLFPKLFGQQVFMLIQSGYDRRYSELLANANRTTRRIVYTAAVLTAAVLFRRNVAGAARSLAAGAVSVVSGVF